MLLLLGTTITASFFDSLNPSAIAQQMLLQAMVKNKRYIWFFIAGIGTANLAMGLAIYYGIAMWVSRLLTHLMAAHPLPVYGTALGAGLICLAAGIRLIVKTRQSRQKTDSEGETPTKMPVHLPPVSLFLMGAGFCAVELTSALPYFGFLAMLTGYHLSVPLVVVFILIYNFMYVLPLILLYFGYNRLQGTAIIRRLEYNLSRVSAYIVPVVVILVGGLLAVYGAASL